MPKDTAAAQPRLAHLCSITVLALGKAMQLRTACSVCIFRHSQLAAAAFVILLLLSYTFEVGPPFQVYHVGWASTQQLLPTQPAQTW